jgi:hypothetical protein
MDRGLADEDERTDVIQQLSDVVVLRGKSTYEARGPGIIFEAYVNRPRE